MKKAMLGILCLLLLLAMSSCSKNKVPSQETDRPVRVVFERGHGSVWGVQFNMDVGPQEIYHTDYFPANDEKPELISAEGVPITEEQWDALEEAVFALAPHLEPEKEPGILKQLLGSKTVVDGGLYRKLTLVWQSGSKETETTYGWPDHANADVLEKLLEQLTNHRRED